MGLYTIKSNHRGHTKGHIFNPIRPLQYGRYRQNGLFIPDDAFTNSLYGHGYAIIRRLFFLNNFIGTVFHTPCNLLRGIFMIIKSSHFAKLMYRNPRHIGTAPCHNLTVSMLPDNKRMHTAAVHTQMPSQFIFEPCRIQNSSGAYHPFLRQTA